MSAGHGGQVLLSLATCELVRDTLPDGAKLLDLGEHRLKDLIRPERVFQVTSAGLLTGDMIVRLDGEPVTGADDLIRLLTGERIGRSVEISVLRLGKPRKFTLMPEERKKAP